jgi:hypothetical protein
MDGTALLVGTIIMVLLFMVFLFTCGAYLGIRASKLRLKYIWFLSLFFFILGLEMVLSVLWNLGLPRPTFIDALVLHACVLMLLAFTHAAFFKEKRSPFRALVVVTSIIGALNVYFGFLQDEPIYSGDARMWRTFVFWLELVIASVWQTRVSFSEYRRFKGSLPRLEPYVLKRYLLHSITSILFVPILFTDFVGTWFNIYKAFDYTITFLANTAILVFYTAANLLIWVMPSWFKDWLNKGPVKQLVAEYKGVSAPSTNLSKKLLTSRETMAIIDHLGNTLATKIKITPSAAKGLILVAIEQHESHSNAITITLSELKDIFLDEINGILTKVGIVEPGKIVNEMVEQIVANQSLLTMMSI